MRNFLLIVCLGLLLPSRADLFAQTKRAGSSSSARAQYSVVDPYLSSTSIADKKIKPWSRKVEEARRSSPKKAKATYKDLLKVDKNNPIAKRYLAEIYLAEGDWDRAKSILGKPKRRKGKEPRDPVPLMYWKVLGPFKNRGRSASIKYEYEPEKKLDLKASYPGDGRVCRWKSVKGPRIDYRDTFDVDGDAVGFGYCEFVSKRDGWVRLGLSSADGMKAWLNDEVILSKPGRRDIEEDDDKIWVWIPRGRNKLLVKVESDGGAFRHYVQIYDEITVPRSDFLSAAIDGKKALARKKYEDARASLLLAEAIEPGNPEVAVTLAEVELRMGNYIGARSWVTKALMDRPAMTRALTIYSETMIAFEQPLRAFDSLRAAYKASGYESSEVFDFWMQTAKRYRSELQEGLAHLDKTRGLRAKKKAREADASLALALPKLESSFVGLAELSGYYRSMGDRKKAAAYGVQSLQKLTNYQVAQHCSPEWLVALARDVRATQPENIAAYRRIMSLVQVTDPGNDSLLSELIGNLDRAQGAEKTEAMKRVEVMLRKKPEKGSYKTYAKYLFDKGHDAKVVIICREGLAAGVVSRKLKYWQGHSLIKLKRLGEAEVVFRNLLKESDYVERANQGLALIQKARGK